MPTVPEARERAALPYHRWSVEGYHRMAQTGLLDETERVELIEGQMIDMAPIGRKHAFLVDRIAESLSGGAHADYMVRVQHPLVLGCRSEPQADIALVRRGDYADRHPAPADVLLIVEVSDTTLEFDRDVNLALYARHGIPEVWLLDVNAKELTRYREPAEGQYRLIRKPMATEEVSPTLVPSAVMRLAEVMA